MRILLALDGMLPASPVLVNQIEKWRRAVKRPQTDGSASAGGAAAASRFFTTRRGLARLGLPQMAPLGALEVQQKICQTDTQIYTC